MIVERKVQLLKKDESNIIKILLISLALIFLFVFLLIPLFTVFHEAFHQGVNFYLASI